MSKSYKDSVNKISLSEEMRQTIIKNTSEAAKKKAKTYNVAYLRRIAGFAACLAVFLLSYHIVTDYGYMPSEVTQPEISIPVPKTDNTENTDNTPTDMPVSETDRSDSATEAIKSAHGNNAATDNTNTDTPPTVSSEEDIPKNAPNIGNEPVNENTEPDESLNGVQAPNPMQSSSDKEQIEKELGYSIKIPSHIPNGYQQGDMCVIGGELVQIIYESENDTICYRTAKGDEDISGDYTAYDKIETVKINDFEVTLKGSNSSYYNAVWLDDDTSYSVSSNNGLEKETMTEIIEHVR